MFNDLSRAMKKIRSRFCSDRNPRMSLAASSDEIMAANVLRECNSFDEAVYWAYKLGLKLLLRRELEKELE